MVIIIKRNRSYNCLLFAEFVSTMGTLVYYVALSVYIYGINNSALALSALALIYTLPGIILAPILGWICDRCDLRKLMGSCELLRCITMILMTFCSNLIFLYILVLIEAGLGIVQESGTGTIIPSLLNNENELLNGNSYMTSSKNISKILGSLLGGVLIGLVDITTLFYFDALMLFISFLSLLSIRYKKVSNLQLTTDDTKKNSADIIGVRQIFLKIKNVKKVILLLLTKVFVMIPVAMITTYLITYTSEVLKRGSSIYGLLSSVNSISGAISGIVIIWIFKYYKAINQIVFNIIILLLSGILLILMVINPTLSVGLIALLALGFAEPLISIVLQTCTQKNVPIDFLGRVIGIQGSACTIVNVIIIFLSGIIIDNFNIKLTFTIFGIITIVFSLEILLYYLRNRTKISLQ